MLPPFISESRIWREFKQKFFNSRFFAISVLFHAILVLMLGTAVIMKAIEEPGEFVGSGDGNGEPPSFVPPMQQEQQEQQEQPDQVAYEQPATVWDQTITTARENPDGPVIPPPTPRIDIANVVPTDTPSKTPVAPVISNQPSMQQLRNIHNFRSGWVSGGPIGPGTNLKERKIEFTAYLAKYSGGDWDSTNVIGTDPNDTKRFGTIIRGSLPNLIYYMNNLSKGNITAHPAHKPLDLASDEIFSVKPPFIFFTGHRDFTLTEKEVENLRKYIQVGGCIWGDSSLPGLRSRFDLAFQREMKRVVGDIDKKWEPLPPNHPMFTKNLYYQEMKEPPPGVNHYKLPVYALKIYDKVAVIYTPNDYGDMWRIALRFIPGEEKKGEKGLEIDKTRDTTILGHPMKFTDETMFYRMEVYYRGMELEKLIDAYKFGTNVVVHLLTRWEDATRQVEGL